jgi:hypothetical protein
MRSTRILLVTALASTLRTGIAKGQDVIPDAVSCSRCVVGVNEVVRLGDTDGPGFLPGFPFSANVDAQGRYWLTFESEVPMVFNAEGRFSARLGRIGQGPEEFRGPYYTLPVGDSVLVLDIGSRSVVVSPDLKVSRSIQLPGYMSVGVSIHWPDTVLFTGLGDPRRPVGARLHLFSLLGARATLLRSLDTLPSAIQRQNPSLLSRRIAYRDDANIWAANAYQYRVVEIKRTGDPIRTLERRPAWFSAPTMRPNGGPNRAPEPSIQTLSIDSAGRLWVYLHQAASTWKEAWPALPQGTSEVAIRAIKFDKLFRTVIEVIDPAAERVVVRAELEGVTIAALPDQRVALYRVLPDGTPFVSIVKLAIVER